MFKNFLLVFALSIAFLDSTFANIRWVPVLPTIPFRREIPENVDEEYVQSWAHEILAAYRLDVKDYPKPEYLTTMEDSAWERAIPLILAGVILCGFPLTRKVGTWLIWYGLGCIGEDAWAAVYHYLKELGIDLYDYISWKPKNSATPKEIIPKKAAPYDYPGRCRLPMFKFNS